jgi:hypothetical protein
MSKQLLKNQKVVSERKKDRREGKGRVLAISRRMYKLEQNSDTFYVESETSDDQYYCVKYNPSSVVESWLCSCKDNSNRHIKCKHSFAIEFAIKWETVKDIDKLPPTSATADVKEDTQIVQIPKSSSSSYKDDDYTF